MVQRSKVERIDRCISDAPQDSRMRNRALRWFSYDQQHVFYPTRIVIFSLSSYFHSPPDRHCTGVGLWRLDSRCWATLPLGANTLRYVVSIFSTGSNSIEGFFFSLSPVKRNHLSSLFNSYLFVVFSWAFFLASRAMAIFHGWTTKGVARYLTQVRTHVGECAYRFDVGNQCFRVAVVS